MGRKVSRFKEPATSMDLVVVAADDVGDDAVLMVAAWTTAEGYPNSSTTLKMMHKMV